MKSRKFGNVRRARVLLGALACAVFLGSCATIPPESQPAVISGEKQPPSSADVPEPPKGIDALTVVRDFVRASALPDNNAAAARVYLDETSRKSWKPASGSTIIDDTFNTVYGADDQHPNDPFSPNQQTVVVRGFNVGTLGADGAFIPSDSPYAQPIHVGKQPDGEWRIVNPSPNLVVTKTDFTTQYSRVSIDFFASDSGVFVPDLRYVVAKPQAGLPSRVMDLLLHGPSSGLNGTAVSLIPDQATIDSNVRVADDGSLTVPLTGIGDQPTETKRRIAAQIVLSLQNVTNSRIRLMSDGAPLVPEREYWRVGDVQSYNASTAPSSQLSGMMTVDGRVKSLGDGQPVPGPAGSGAYSVASAAQSIDGKRLAVVERVEGGMRLRVGDLNRDLQPIGLTGAGLTRPTWRPASAGGGTSSEVWTVVDGSTVARVVQSPDGRWTKQGVNATPVGALGQISELRLSRDGARVAAVAGGHLVVASVVRTADGVALREPRSLDSRELTNVVGVDWLGQETLVAATSSSSLPVLKVPIDGLRADPFNSSNLTPQVHAVTAAPNRPIVVADMSGLWVASELGEVWSPHAHTVLDAYPFYPG